jgi:ribosome-associated protein
MQKPTQDDIRALHQLERWRDALIAGDEACLAEIAARAPAFDRELVQQLAAAARQEREAARPPKSARRLYAYLRQL